MSRLPLPLLARASGAVAAPRAALRIASTGVLLLALSGATVAEGLWDKVKSGASATLERGGELIQQGAEKGLQIGGAVAEQGVAAGQRAIEDLEGHFNRQGTPEEIRQRIDTMALETLDRLFAADPEAALRFSMGFGYAVFDVRQVSLTVTAGYGYGVAVAADGMERTYMKMATGGLELKKGIGGFEARWVVLFDDEDAFRRFIAEGFEASAEAGGMALTEQASVRQGYRQGVAFYKVTDGGLKLSALLAGTRFWPDAALNDYDPVPAPVLALPPVEAADPGRAPAEVLEATAPIGIGPPRESLPTSESTSDPESELGSAPGAAPESAPAPGLEFAPPAAPEPSR